MNFFVYIKLNIVEHVMTTLSRNLKMRIITIFRLTVYLINYYLSLHFEILEPFKFAFSEYFLHFQFIKKEEKMN